MCKKGLIKGLLVVETVATEGNCLILPFISIGIQIQEK
jgi:hypothetical protein